MDRRTFLKAGSILVAPAIVDSTGLFRAASKLWTPKVTLWSLGGVRDGALSVSLVAALYREDGTIYIQDTLFGVDDRELGLIRMDEQGNIIRPTQEQLDEQGSNYTGITDTLSAGISVHAMRDAPYSDPWFQRS